MIDELVKVLKDQKFKSDIWAIIFLLFFQLLFYFVIVFQNNNNLLPIHHEINIDTFTFQDAPESYFTECGHKQDEKASLKLNVLGKGQYKYQTDSVEIVKGHFGDNITSQFLLLAVCAIALFIVFLLLGIHPAPFLVPLFIILTISVYYHNYLGTRITDSVSVPIERVLCENCTDGYVIRAKDNDNDKCDRYYKIPDKYITEKLIDGEKIKEKTLKIDRQKVREVVKEALAMGVLKIYPKSTNVPIELNPQKNPTRGESNNNKYERASQPAKKHFNWILLGFVFFLLSIIAAKCFSKIDNISNKKLFVSIAVLFLIVAGIWVGWGKYATAEFLKLAAILVTIIGYEKFSTYTKIKKHKFRVYFWGYIIILLCEMIILLLFKDFGNLLILLLICCLVAFLALPQGIIKKIFGIAPFVVVVVAICLCYSCDERLEYLLQYDYLPEPLEQKLNLRATIKEMHILWRIPDTGNGLTEPLCKMTVVGKNGDNVDWSYSFYSQGERKDLLHEICYIKNDEDKKIGFYEVKNCEDKLKIECDVEEIQVCTLNLEENKSQNCSTATVGERKKLFNKGNCNVIDKRCSEKNGADEKITHYEVRNCKDKPKMGCDIVKECRPEEDAQKTKDKKVIKCVDTAKEKKRNEFDKNDCSDEPLDCKQVNTDARWTLFAILKDGIPVMPKGFKENTFLLNNDYMYTDFVFLGLIAFFGIVITFLVLFCLGMLVLNCNIKQKECGDHYKHFLYSNIMVIILGLQVIIHIGGNLNIIPFTGVALPFLSQGGASMLVSFITLGLALGGLVSDGSWLFNKLVWPIVEKIKGRFGNLRKKTR